MACAKADGTTNSAILLRGTNNKPGGDYDTGLIWGDYYFLEALLRARPVALTNGIVPTSDTEQLSDVLSARLLADRR